MAKDVLEEFWCKKYNLTGVNKIKKRALISVFNKDGILELASFLNEAGWEIISTGGTSKYLQENNIPVTDVSSVTGFPECLDGRVKTLHPAIHAGILARRKIPEHIHTLQKLNLSAIDLVCVNLYPFFDKVKDKLPQDELIEFIDIGGPSMLRSAAKNFCDVIVICEPADYSTVIESIKNNCVTLEIRKRLASKVFSLTSSYDAAVARFLLDEEYPGYLPLSLKRAQTLRYGENNHQSAALYLNTDHTGALGGMEQLHGKEMGYNNIRDLDSAWKAVSAFSSPEQEMKSVDDDTVNKLIKTFNENKKACCAAIKHNTPCGIALGSTVNEAFEKVYACDPVSIFGGIVAFNEKLIYECASKLSELFLEVVAAPDFEKDALLLLKKKKNLRIIKMNKAPLDSYDYISVDGGLLVQQTDRRLLEKWEIVTKTPVDDQYIADMFFGIRAVTYAKSNAIIVVKEQAAIGIGAGQVNRIWSTVQALERSAYSIEKAKESTSDEGGSPWRDNSPARVLASDAFFPFADVVEQAAKAGIKSIIQPGGSINDKLSIEACDKHGISMVFTGTRHFKH